MSATDLEPRSLDGLVEGDRDSYSLEREDVYQAHVKILYGAYADILFVMLPFTVVGIFKLWQNDIKDLLMSYDLSLAASVLAGLAVVKFIMGVIIDPRMLKYKERLLFLVSGVVFLILVPGLLFSVLIMLSDPVPEFVMFVQPMLIILSITAYSSAVTSTNMLLEKSKRLPNALLDDQELEQA